MDSNHRATQAAYRFSGPTPSASWVYLHQLLPPEEKCTTCNLALHPVDQPFIGPIHVPVHFFRRPLSFFREELRYAHISRFTLRQPACRPIRAEGLEPSPPKGERFLRPLRKPFRHARKSPPRRAINREDRRTLLPLALSRLLQGKMRQASRPDTSLRKRSSLCLPRST